MTRHALTVATLLAAVLTAPATAQQVISEPGYCAQFYPNANCQNKGPGNPYSDGGYWRDTSAQPTGYMPVTEPRRYHHRARKHVH
jgi:hypothetical protein